jgi:hypothetical protein
MKNKLGATVRSIEKRKVSVFPAMEYCDTCKQFTETRCIHESKERVFSGRFSDAFDLWMKSAQGVFIPNIVSA